LAADPFIDAGGELIAHEFLCFFLYHVHNDNTRRAYARAIGQFIGWCEKQALPSVAEVDFSHVTGFLAGTQMLTAKQRLAALRSLFSYLWTKKALPLNPAAAVRVSEASSRSIT